MAFRSASARSDRAGTTLFGQQNIGLDIADPGQGHHSSSQDTFEIGDIAGRDAQAVIVKPQHLLNGKNLRNCADRAFEILKTDPPARGQFDAQKHRHSKAQLFRVQIDPPSLDHAIVLKPADASPCRWLGQAQKAAKGAGALRGIGGQRAQQRPVGFIKVDHIGNVSAILMVLM